MFIFRRPVRFFFAFVGSALLAFFLCGCVHLPPGDFTFVQMCDPQIGFADYDQDLTRFKQAVSQINQIRPAFVVICGDLVNNPNNKSFADFNEVKRNLSCPCYSAPGNHDLGNAPTAASLKKYRKSEGKDYYSFKNRGRTFLVLNTQLWKNTVPGETERQDTWLRTALLHAEAKSSPLFVVEHYPPFVKTAEEPDAYFNLPLPKRTELLENFQRSGVRAILAGHTHTTTVQHYRDIEIITSQTTSRNFDKKPYGFRLWHVKPDGAFTHEFVPLEGSR